VDGTVVALVARGVLAVVLVVAAVAKLRSPKATREQVVALFGTRAGPVIARALPVVELLLAVSLLVWWTAVPGIVTTVLLLAFTVVLVRASLRKLPCACFGGATSSRPAGGGAVLRNAALIVLAILATGSPR
jgi:hypothetical protein